MSHLRILTALLVAAVAAGLARAEECPAAQLVTSVAMKVGDDGRIYVPVKVNDVAKSMLVDTGGFISALTRQTVDGLKLPTRHTRHVLVGVGGDTTNTATHASFLLGALRTDTDFMVIPDATGFASDVMDVVGLLAPNLFRSYDVEIDFGTMKFSLYSQQHCDGKAVRWSGGMVVLPMRIDATDHIQIPVQLDGQNLKAILDTGATRSVLDVELAKNTFGLTPGDSNTPEVGRLARAPESKTYAHHFKSLALGGIAVADPAVRLIPDLARNRSKAPRSNPEGRPRLSKSTEKPGFGDMILGMNVIREWHLYIAYKERKLYLARSRVAVSIDHASGADQTAAIRGQPATDPLKRADVHPH